MAAPCELEKLRAVIEEKDREIERLKKVSNLDQAKYFMRISVANSDLRWQRFTFVRCNGDGFEQVPAAYQYSEG